MKTYKKMLVILSIMFMTLLFNKVYAAGVTISVSKQEVEIGSTFTVTVTGTGAATYDIKASVSGAGISDTINLNAYTEDLSNATKKTSKTYTAKQKGTVNISIKSGSNATVAGGRGSQPITGSSKTVNIIDKKPVETQKPVEQKPVTPAPTTTNKTTTTKKTENKKTEKIVETKEKEEAKPELGIHSLKLIGVKENGEEIEVSLDKEFNIKTFDYTCNVTNDIKSLKIEKEAYEYNDLVQISGLEEELKVGENTITLKLSSDGKEVTYTIKVTKEEKLETDETLLTNAEPEKQKTEGIIVSIPLVWFIVLEVLLVTVSAAVTVFVMRYLKSSKGKKTKI